MNLFRKRNSESRTTLGPDRGRDTGQDQGTDRAPSREPVRGSVPARSFDPTSTFADAQTLRDLNIFPPEGDGTSVFQIFDRTRTSLGREALRRLLSQPTGSVEEIHERQNSVRYFVDSANRERWDFRASDRGMGYLEKYLESYIRPLEGKRGLSYFVRALWYRTNYKKYFEHLDSCVRRTHRYLLGVQALIAQVEGHSNEVPLTPLPRRLQAHFDRLKRLLAHPVAAVLLRTGGKESRFRSWDSLFFDQHLRGDLCPVLREALDSCYEIDAWKSIGIVTAERQLLFPDVLPRKEPGAALEAEGIWHPFLEEPTANDIALDAERNFVLVTGPNMAGKTTFLKAIGICVYLAHLGMPVPAKSFSLPIFDGICSSLNVIDNIEKGYSYFYTEVDRVKTVAQLLHDGRDLFVLFDELFKGTNIKDAFDGSSLVIRGFLRFPGSRFLVSSHLVELKDRLDEELSSEFETRTTSPIQYVYFDSAVHEGQPQFSYQLRPGVSAERLGLLILKNEGIEDLLGVRT